MSAAHHPSSRTIRAYELQHRESALLDLLQSYPSHVLRGLAEQPEAEWNYGRLFLLGIITHDQYSAAKHLDQVTRTYEKLLRNYGDVHAMDPMKTSRTASEDLSLSAQKKFARVKKRYDYVYSLLNQCGTDVHDAVIDTLRRDEKTKLDLVRRGLTVLAAGVSKPVKRRIR